MWILVNFFFWIWIRISVNSCKFLPKLWIITNSWEFKQFVFLLSGSSCEFKKILILANSCEWLWTFANSYKIVWNMYELKCLLFLIQMYSIVIVIQLHQETHFWPHMVRETRPQIVNFCIIILSLLCNWCVTFTQTSITFEPLDRS